MPDEFARKVLPGNPEGLFGPPIADSLDRIPMFDRDGQPVLVINGALEVVHSRMLAWILDAYFVTVHAVQRGARLEVGYRGVVFNEMVLGHMLREEETKRGGLLGRLPKLVIEQPQVKLWQPKKSRRKQRRICLKFNAS
jgi:hypothetical protein